MPRPIYFVCNIISDELRKERGIFTDSPAATRKVLLLASELAGSGRNVKIVSMSRGKSTKKQKYFSASVEHREKFIVYNLPFLNLPYMTYIWSMLYLSLYLFKSEKNANVLFYNRLFLYLPCLLIARLKGMACYLDLEDANVIGTQSLKNLPLRLYIYLFDALAKDGVILANSKMQKFTNISNSAVYYGSVEKVDVNKNVSRDVVRCLFSGTISTETGAQTLYEAIRELKDKQYVWAEKLEFSICGAGESLVNFKKLEAMPVKPSVKVYGRLSFDDYKVVLSECEIGFSLKPVNGKYADTTFPSKVIEYACSGLTLITTDISDVRLLLGNGALYLNANSPFQIVDSLNKYVKSREQYLVNRCNIKNILEQKILNKYSGESLNALFK